MEIQSCWRLSIMEVPGKKVGTKINPKKQWLKTSNSWWQILISMFKMKEPQTAWTHLVETLRGKVKSIRRNQPIVSRNLLWDGEHTDHQEPWSTGHGWGPAGSRADDSCYGEHVQLGETQKWKGRAENIAIGPTSQEIQDVVCTGRK